MISGYNFDVTRKTITLSKEDNPSINLGDRGFSIGLALFDDSNNTMPFFDESYFKYKLESVTVNKTAKTYNKQSIVISN